MESFVLLVAYLYSKQLSHEIYLYQPGRIVFINRMLCLLYTFSIKSTPMGFDSKGMMSKYMSAWGY